MKILSVVSARSIWLFPTMQLNPRGRYLGDVFASFASRYQFSKIPEGKEISVSPLSLKFQDGVFQNASGQLIYASLSIHDDGLIAETRESTQESDRFMTDALEWFSSEFDLPHHAELSINRVYVSELIVETKLPLSIFSDEFSAFTAKLRRGGTNGFGKPLELTALHFNADPASTKAPAPFRLERLADKPFKDNLYYSAAPLRTADHLELLELLTNAAERSEPSDGI